MVAGQAASFATQFNGALAGALEGPEPFLVELMSPPGPSTEGGKQALQHVRLVPRGNVPAIVIGSVNTKEFVAEIRTYGMIVDNYASRFKGASPPIDPDRYAALVKQMKTFLASQGFTVTLIAVSASVRPPPPGALPSRSPWVATAVVAVLVLLGLSGYLFFRAR